MAQPHVVTEDLGKVCEMAFCLLANTPYQGTYRYSLEKAETLKDRFKELEPEFRGMRHTGTHDDLYDFTHETNPDLKMSIKSNKTGWMVCPQGGQGTKKTFCQKFDLSPLGHTDPQSIKAFVVAETARVLTEFTNTTFHCPVIYYNAPYNLVQHIKPIRQTNLIDWATIPLRFSHIEKGKEWNESTTLYILRDRNLIPIGEFQNHRNRNCFKFRFHFKNLLDQFKDHFEIRTL
jgi:hypothetical protein